MSDTLTAQRALRGLADEYECEATVESVAKAVYKNTDCGCYFDIVGGTVIVGTIVEGTDVEHNVKLLLEEYFNDRHGASGFVDDVCAALSDCEDFAERVFGYDAYPDANIYDHIYGDNGIDLLDW